MSPWPLAVIQPRTVTNCNMYTICIAAWPPLVVLCHPGSHSNSQQNILTGATTYNNGTYHEFALLWAVQLYSRVAVVRRQAEIGVSLAPAAAARLDDTSVSYMIASTRTLRGVRAEDSKAYIGAV